MAVWMGQGGDSARWKVAPDAAGQSQAGVLRLECAGLGIGNREGAIRLVLDAAGVVREPGEFAAAGLPEFRFEPVRGIVIGNPGPEPCFAVAAEIAVVWGRDWGERLGPLVQIREKGKSGLTVTTAEGVEVDFLAMDLERQFRNLERIWRQTQRDEREIATINLMPVRNVPVTFR
jgi:hypothetical protein